MPPSRSTGGDRGLVQEVGGGLRGSSRSCAPPEVSRRCHPPRALLTGSSSPVRGLAGPGGSCGTWGPAACPHPTAAEPFPQLSSAFRARVTNPGVFHHATLLRSYGQL